MVVTSNLTKNLTLSTEIKAGDITVKTKTATIDSLTGQISFSEWIGDMDLYKANRAEVRKQEMQFEDLAFVEQEKLLAEDNK